MKRRWVVFTTVMAMAVMAASTCSGQELLPDSLAQDEVLVESMDCEAALEDMSVPEEEASLEIMSVPEETVIQEDMSISDDAAIREEDVLIIEENEFLLGVEEAEDLPVDLNSQTYGNEGQEEEVFTDTITGTLKESGLASFAAPAEKGRYNGGMFLGDYGSQLDPLAKSVYDQMKASFVDQLRTGEVTVTFPSSFVFYTGGTPDNMGGLSWNKESNAQYQEAYLAMEYALQSSYDALVYDYPELFWIRGFGYSATISFSRVGSDYIGTISSAKMKPFEAYTGAMGESRSFYNAVNAAAGSIPWGSSKAYTAKNIHDYLCSKLTYREGPYAHSAAGVFLHGGYVVCEGYAKAFKILCRKFGIDCVLVVGDAGGGHMWNYVKLENNNWYLVDVTWDDQTYGTIYNYFLAGSQSASAGSVIGRERTLYTNFSGGEYTQNFAYPILCDTNYDFGDHFHTWVVYAEQKPTCTQGGYCDYVCASCLAHTYEKLDKLGHSFKNRTYIDNQDATCLKDGTKTAVCDHGCGTTRQTVTVPGSRIRPTITVTASAVKLKTGQSTGKFRVSGLGPEDYIKSVQSADNKIVKVNWKADGTCTLKAGKKKGSTSITVTLASGLMKIVKVKVQSGTVTTEKISGVPGKLILTKGDTYQIPASVTPFTSVEKISYSSSAKKIVSVSKKGFLKAKKKGKAVITVSSGKKSVKCKVTVR